VPYLILLILIGIPLFFLELAVGQRIRRGSIGVWNYVYPQLGGIGVSSLMVSVNHTLKYDLITLGLHVITYVLINGSCLQSTAVSGSVMCALRTKSYHHFANM